MLHTPRLITALFTVQTGRFVVHPRSARAERATEPTMTEASAEFATLVAAHVLPPAESIPKSITLFR
jgi:hypothetical protein